MPIIGDKIGYFILRKIAKRTNDENKKASPRRNKKSLTTFFGENFYEEIKGKIVIAFGCGFGEEVIDIALHGAERVIGVDVREQVLSQARELAIKYGVSEKCIFTSQANEKADIIISKDAFEHFNDPGAVLKKNEWSFKAWRLYSCSIWANLVSSVRRSFIFCFSLGTLNFYRKCVNAVAL